MIEVAAHALPSDKARTLLRRLRDLNLVCGPVAITSDLAVIVSGCLSLDAPVEGGVAYRLRDQHGREGRLDLRCEGPRLRVEIDGIGARRLDVQLTLDRLGRACARSIGGRVRPETTSQLELEHFLRRLLRASLA
ncbi:MAG: hypothetical protein ACK57N_07135 [Planctomycetia bacterium]|jgi:hypothetical protein